MKASLPKKHKKRPTKTEGNKPSTQGYIEYTPPVRQRINNRVPPIMLQKGLQSKEIRKMLANNGFHPAILRTNKASKLVI